MIELNELRAEIIATLTKAGFVEIHEFDPELPRNWYSYQTTFVHPDMVRIHAGLEPNRFAPNGTEPFRNYPGIRVDISEKYRSNGTTANASYLIECDRIEEFEDRLEINNYVPRYRPESTARHCVKIYNRFGPKKRAELLAEAIAWCFAHGGAQ